MNFTASVSAEMAPASPILLRSTGGQEILNRATAHVNHRMINIYNEHNSRSADGIAALVLLINTLNVAYRINYMQLEGESIYEKQRAGMLRVTDDDIINSKMVRSYMASRNIDHKKLTLQQLQNIAFYLGFGANAHFAFAHNPLENGDTRTKLTDALGKNVRLYLFKDIGELRDFAKDYIRRPVTGLIVNFDAKSIDHRVSSTESQFSTLAGYDVKTDRFLVVSASPSSPPQWITSEDLFKAMTSIDSESGLPRGLLHVHELLQ